MTKGNGKKDSREVTAQQAFAKMVYKIVLGPDIR